MIVTKVHDQRVLMTYCQRDERGKEKKLPRVGGSVDFAAKKNKRKKGKKNALCFFATDARNRRMNYYYCRH